MKNKMKDEMLSHLKGDIAPFWLNLIDREYGGFYGLLTYDLKLDKKAVKGCICQSHSRFFSICFRTHQRGGQFLAC